MAVSTQSTLRASARSGGCWVLGCHPPRLGVVASPPPAPRILPASSCSQRQGVLVRRPRVPLPSSSRLRPPSLSPPPSSPPSPRHTCPPLPWSRPPFRPSLPRLRWCHPRPSSLCHRRPTHYPPHEQSLVRLGVRGASQRGGWCGVVLVVSSRPPLAVPLVVAPSPRVVASSSPFSSTPSPPSPRRCRPSSLLCVSHPTHPVSGRSHRW